MTTETKPDMILFLSDARGVYIPRDFATSIKRECVTGVSPEDWAALEAGPEHEWYWETWESVCNHALVTDEQGNVFRVYQEGDCWLIPDGMEWNERRECFDWPEEEEDEEVVEPEDQDEGSLGDDIERDEP